MPSRSQVRVAVDATGAIISAEDYYAYGEILRGYAAGSGNNDRYKFTEKERDAESDYDYFGARYYDSELGRWLSVDPLAAKYLEWSPYNYCFNNSLIIIDPGGRDSTFYIQVTALANNVSQADIDVMAAQVQKGLTENNVGFKVVTTKGHVNTDENDLVVQVANDNHSLIKSARAKNPSSEGVSPVGSGGGVVTTDTQTRHSDLTSVGMGNVILHEGMHGAGVSHSAHGQEGTIIYPTGSTTTVKDLNNPSQKMSNSQMNVLNNWLKRK